MKYSSISYGSASFCSLCHQENLQRTKINWMVCKDFNTLNHSKVENCPFYYRKRQTILNHEMAFSSIKNGQCCQTSLSAWPKIYKIFSLKVPFNCIAWSNAFRHCHVVFLGNVHPHIELLWMKLQPRKYQWKLPLDIATLLLINHTHNNIHIHFLGKYSSNPFSDTFAYEETRCM